MYIWEIKIFFKNYFKKSKILEMMVFKIKFRWILFIRIFGIGGVGYEIIIERKEVL